MGRASSFASVGRGPFYNIGTIVEDDDCEEEGKPKSLEEWLLDRYDFDDSYRAKIKSVCEIYKKLSFPKQYKFMQFLHSSTKNLTEIHTFISALQMLSNKSHWLEHKENICIFAPEGIYVYWKDGSETLYSKHRYGEYNKKDPQAEMWIAELAMMNCIRAGINQ